VTDPSDPPPPDAPQEAPLPDAPSGDAGDREPAAGRSRRDFLRAGGFAAAGLLAGGAVAGAVGAVAGHSAGYQEGEEDYGPLKARKEPGFDHIVVLMGENRSMDNLLGWLYTPDTIPAGQTFDGLAFGTYSNIAPDGRTVPAHVYSGATDEIMRSPDPDPGEEYPYVNTQLFGTIDPPENALRFPRDVRPPYNAPPAGAKPTMSGFVRDYHDDFRRKSGGRIPTPVQTDRIMGGFSPEQLPVLSTLAREFAVYDDWHAAVPSQTYTNRSFFHASTSHGFVTNGVDPGPGKWLRAPAVPTIFDRLEAAGLTWKVYFDELQIVSLTGVLHSPSLEKYWHTEHFVYMTDFYKDAADGTLPAYAFIEPRLVYNHNDFHPPVGVYRSSTVDGKLILDSAVSDVRAGEKLVAQVYDAIRTSATARGSNALNTLLLITFDEHGGTYDHVPPGPAKPPSSSDGPGEMGFTFDRLGVRVPAIAVSAYTRRGTIIHDEMHHGSVIATLCRRHGLDPLTARDDGANTLYNAVNLTKARDPRRWPTVQAPYVPPNPDEDELKDLTKGDERDLPLSPPGRGLLGLLIAKYGNPDEPEPETYADAYRILHDHGFGLFYPKSD
jgi:phospholipase C